MKKKYLVTGATGFLGKALTKELLSLGHEVLCISRKEDGELIKLGAKFFCADISIGLPQNINEILKEVDTVFHTAAKVAMWGNYVEFYRTNLLGTFRFLPCFLNSYL